MMKLLQAIIGRIAPQPLNPELEGLIAEAVERIDPRLKAFGNCPRAYRPAIGTALEYAESLVTELPSPLCICPSNFAREPMLHSLFAGVESIFSTVSESREVKVHCQQYGKPDSDELFALMGMRRHEKHVFGRELRGDVVQQDVQQTVVYFDSHTLILPSLSEAQLRQNLKLHLVNSLMESFHELVAEALNNRRELEVERDTLVAHLRSKADAQQEERLQAVRQQLTGLNSEYALTNFPRLLENFVDEREKYLRLELREIPIDMRGVMRESDERLAGKFTFFDLIGRDRRCWTLCPVRLSVKELQHAMHCDTDRERWLDI